MNSVDRKVVLVSGANGYIGLAVSKAFVRAGYITYGLIRHEKSKKALEVSEIIPIVGTPGNVDTWTNQLSLGYPRIIVSTSEDINDYQGHYEEKLVMLLHLSRLNEKSKPLVLFTSGCKDYGRTRLEGDPKLEGSKESDTLFPPPFLSERSHLALQTLKHRDVFDSVIIRPTTLYGYDGSYYGSAFERAELARRNNSPLIIPSKKESIMHGCHIDDCAEAYVSLANEDIRQHVIGQAFNISASRYETAGEIANKLAEEYQIDTIKFEPEEGTEDTKIENILFAFSQWVNSDKIRQTTGWTDVRRSFQDGIAVYRKAYEAYRS